MKHADKIKAKKPAPEEPPFTMPQYNAMLRELPEAPVHFIEEIGRRLSDEDYNRMRPLLGPIGQIIGVLLSKNFYDNTCFDPHPNNASELRLRFDSNENELPSFFKNEGLPLDEGAQTVFRAAYRQVCNRLERAMMQDYPMVGAQQTTYLQ